MDPSILNLLPSNQLLMATNLQIQYGYLMLCKRTQFATIKSTTDIGKSSKTIQLSPNMLFQTS